MAERVLVGDIGGTHARFAIAGDDSAPVVLEVAAHADAGSALAAALGRLDAPRADAVRLAVAGIVEGGRAALTNGDWRFDRDEIARRTGAATVELFNDAQAAALSLPALPPQAAMPLGGPEALDTTRPVALLMVGTGLGVSCLVPVPGGHVALATEAGHATLPAAPEDAALVARLRRTAGRVSTESVVSGGGLAALHAAMGGDGTTTAAAVVADALAGRAPAAAALDRFCAFLGAVAGDLALAFGAWGGVAIGGGVPRRFAGFLRASPFRARFVGDGRFAGRLRAVPTVLFERDDLALVGLARGGAVTGTAAAP